MTDVGLGHNRPPEELNEAFIQRKDALMEGMVRLIDENPALDTQEIADKLANFQTQFLDLRKQIDKERERQKKPHLDAANAVQARFKSLLEFMDKAIERVRARTTEALTNVNRIREEARKREAEELERKRLELENAQAEAMRLEAKAEQGEPVGGRLIESDERLIAAQAALDAQEKEVKALQGNAKGGTGVIDGKKKTITLHTYYSAEITDFVRWTRYLLLERNPKLYNLLQELADAEVRKRVADKTLDELPSGLNVLSRQQAQ